MKAVVVLGCEGRTDDNFSFCKGVSNTILDLEKIRATKNYTSIIEYLNGVVGIFDKPCCSMNVIANAIYKIYEFGYIDESKYKHITNFYTFHRRCGLVLWCLPKGMNNE
jgi:hypothetical protein